MDIDKIILKPINGMDFILNLYEVPKQTFADEFDVEPSAISNWRKRGVPKKYAKKLEERFGIEIKYFNKELTPHEQLMLMNQKQNKELIEEAILVTETIKDENGELLEIETEHIDLTSVQKASYETARRSMTFNMMIMLQAHQSIDDNGNIGFEHAKNRVVLLESFIRLLKHKGLDMKLIDMIISAIRDSENLPRSDYGIEPRNEEFVRLLSTQIKQFKNGGQQDEQK